MITRLIVWSLGALVALVLFTACARPVYICQAMPPGMLVCADSREFSKETE